MLQVGSDGTCSCSVLFIACQIISEVLYVQNGTVLYVTVRAVLASMRLTMYEHTARQNNKQASCQIKSKHLLYISLRTK